MDKTLKVRGMHCRSCEILLTDIITEVDGVSDVKVDLRGGTVSLKYENEFVLDRIKESIESEGYVVVA
ncbi:Heavy-metal-associated domain protein [Candidatus Bilamarchaeum dharawalense]|uniref:Heavy-metal-associated domain protein n=1 Tax=Candidatus Bilamarchaeum dharawalense TaxID=2885759 RepID=A0A5E4LME8_9ARCH|nr:Heavy-metal-associated domain protein [Candidatus Bilamarchaeum dharawalense]